jgi:hypothetical protein
MLPLIGMTGSASRINHLRHFAAKDGVVSDG